MQKSGYINLYSDISFFIQLIDETLKGKKIIKREENNINKMKKIFSEIIKEEIEPKRTNSMTALRPHSQTIDSKATRDSSLKRENSDLNKQSSQKNINIIKDLNNCNKCDKEKMNLKEENKNEIITEEKNETNIINESIQKNEFTFEEFLNKIINDDNYIKDNVKLIYHFCQQCFCFIKVEALFEQIMKCYEGLQKDNLDGKFDKLIEFTDVLVMEMIYYCGGENSIDKNIVIAKGFYNKLLSDLILNLGNNNDDNIFEEKNEEKNSIEPNKLEEDENNIINDNKNIIEENNNYESNKKDLIKMNIASEWMFVPKEEEKKILLKKSKSNSLKKKQSNRKSVHFLEKGKTMEDLEEPSEKLETKRMSFTPQIKTKHFSLNKRKVKDTIKEEDEDFAESDDDKRKESSDSNKDLFSDDDSSNENNEKNNINIKKDKNIKENKEKEQNKVKEFVEKLVEKSNIPEIFNSKEIQIDNLDYKLMVLGEITEKEENEEEKDKYLETVKEKIKFYIELKKRINLEKINNRLSKKRMTTSNPTNPFMRLSSKKSISREIKAYFCVTDWKTEDIGNQLMLISKSLISKIHPRELYKAIFLKKDKEITSPNVVECINKFNRLTSFIMEDILSYNKAKDRAKAYEKWVLIADYCKKIKDFNDLIAIFSAFNHYVITGLKLTLKEVKSKTNSILNKLRNFCRVEGNYKKIREEMDNCDKKGEIFIPYLGMLLRDLNFFEEKSKYINEKGFINFDKIEKISEMFELYFKFRDKIDAVNKIPELEFFNDLEDITEEKLEEIGNNIEPQFKYEPTNKKKRRTNIDKKYFAKYKNKEDNDSCDGENEENKGEPVDLDTAFYE